MSPEVYVKQIETGREEDHKQALMVVTHVTVPNPDHGVEDSQLSIEVTDGITVWAAKQVTAEHLSAPPAVRDRMKITLLALTDKYPSLQHQFAYNLQDHDRKQEVSFTIRYTPKDADYAITLRIRLHSVDDAHVRLAKMFTSLQSSLHELIDSQNQLQQLRSWRESQLTEASDMLTTHVEPADGVEKRLYEGIAKALNSTTRVLRSARPNAATEQEEVPSERVAVDEGAAEQENDFTDLAEESEEEAMSDVEEMGRGTSAWSPERSPDGPVTDR